jgi:hypothetical protein
VLFEALKALKEYERILVDSRYTAVYEYEYGSMRMLVDSSVQ